MVCDMKIKNTITQLIKKIDLAEWLIENYMGETVLPKILGDVLSDIAELIDKIRIWRILSGCQIKIDEMFQDYVVSTIVLEWARADYEAERNTV